MGNPVSELQLFGTRGSPAAYSIRDFLQRSDVPFRWVELTTDEQARTEANVEGLGDSRLPVCMFPDGTRLERPTVRQVTEKLGWFLNPSQAEYDVAIYGGGPAGLSAAVYGASEGLKTVLIERSAIGGQASTTSKIENYLGFPGGISGAELAMRAAKQAHQFGAEILILREGIRGEIRAGKGIGFLADGTKIVTRATICATGINYRRLELPNEAAFHMNGVYYGAGSSEAALCTGEHVFVVGGGNSAGQAATHPLAPGRIYSAAGDGYFESSDAGDSWRSPEDGLKHLYLVGVAVDPADLDTVIVSATAGPGSAYSPQRAEAYVYRKTGLKRWELAMSGLPEAKGTTVSRFATHAGEPGVIYAANNRGLFRSGDAGRSWKAMDLPWPGPGLADGVAALACLPE